MRIVDYVGGFFVLFFTGLALRALISALGARLSGWRRLAAMYGDGGPRPATRNWKRCHILVGERGASCHVTVCVDPDGLSVSCPGLWSGYRPFFVPWSDVSTYRDDTQFVDREFSKTWFRFRRAPDVPIGIPSRIAKEMAEAVKTDWDGKSVAATDAEEAYNRLLLEQFGARPPSRDGGGNGTAV